MKKTAIAKLAASTLVIGVTTVGFGVSGQAQRPTAVSAADSLRMASNAAKHAAKALVKKDAVKALRFAELAVEFQPRNADYRMLLGQAYLASGRFAAAETSFSDTLTLDPERDRAALNLALAQIALGKKDAARSTLADYRDKLPAADFGLAVALAGDADEAVRVLEFATRAPDANAKTRQNLALAYALAGKWANARVMAVQDLDPDSAEDRLSQWATFVRPKGAADQVAGLLGVQPREDAGQPSRLALATPAAPVAVAIAEPAPAPAPVVTAAPAPAPVVVAAADPAPAPAFEVAPVAPEPVVAVAQPAVVAPAPIIRAPVRPVRTAVAVAPRAPALRPAVAVRPVTGGKFVVQLGAFSSANAAQRAWGSVSGRFGLASYDPVGGSARVRNANLVRLAVSGFATRADADRVCGRVKARGGVCFVRVQAGDAPAQWAQRAPAKPLKVASR